MSQEADGAVAGGKVTGHAGSPSSGVVRWTPRRKLALIAAIGQATITEDEARERYMLSREELAAWKQAFERHGLDGLHVRSRRRRRQANTRY